MLEVRQLDYRINNKTILNAIDLQLGSGQIVGVLGPNGAGKTSLLKHLGGQLEAPEKVFWQGQDLSLLSMIDKARQIAIVNQFNQDVFALSLEQIVTMGRLPHLSMFKATSNTDRHAVAVAIEQVELSAKAHQAYHTLSGGEQQRALIARALAQRAKLIVLDEPVNHLDIFYQHQILQLLRRLASRLQLTIVMSLHDINLASAYCQNLCLLDHGELIATGTPDEVLKPARLQRVFKLACDVHAAANGKPLRVDFSPDRLVSAHNQVGLSHAN